MTVAIRATGESKTAPDVPDWHRTSQRHRPGRGGGAATRGGPAQLSPGRHRRGPKPAEREAGARVKMAEYLASIFGTEKDKVNCSFYFKIGACRHGDRCSRLHNKPTFSQTIVLLNLYRNPQNTAQTADGSHCHVSDVEVQEHYDNFFEEVFTELQEKYGEIEEMNVCDNLGDHLVGNVYVKFRREEDAERAVAELNNRWFNGQAVHAELSPVTDFRESCCRQYEMGECTRGGFCNFMHLRPISRNLRRQLYGRGPRHRSPPRSHTGHRPRERNRRRSPDHRHGRF